MVKILKSGIENRIKNRLKMLSSGRARNYFLIHFDYPAKEKTMDEEVIKKYITNIEETIPKIETLLKAYRKKIPHIWDQTEYAASYLLIGKAFNNLKTIITVAKAGSNQEVVELCRSAVESLDLAFLFLEDKEQVLLKKWFKGEIIANREARKAFQNIINNEADNNEIPISDVKSDVYDIYSLYTHSAYSALLDSVDVFYEDFDFKKNAGFHHTKRNLNLIDNVCINIFLCLKNAFIKTNDYSNTMEINKLLKNIGLVDMSKTAIQEMFEPYKAKKT